MSKKTIPVRRNLFVNATVGALSVGVAHCSTRYPHPRCTNDCQNGFCFSPGRYHAHCSFGSLHFSISFACDPLPVHFIWKQPPQQTWNMEGSKFQTKTKTWNTTLFGSNVCVQAGWCVFQLCGSHHRTPSPQRLAIGTAPVPTPLSELSTSLALLYCCPCLVREIIVEIFCLVGLTATDFKRSKM